MVEKECEFTRIYNPPLIPYAGWKLPGTSRIIESVTPVGIPLQCGKTVEVVELLTSEQLRALCEWYPVGDPISEVVGLGPKEWGLFADAWLSRCVGNGLSFAAYLDGEMVAAVVCEKNDDPPTMPKEANMDVVMALLDELEAPMAISYGKEKWASMYRVLVVSTKPSARNMGLLKMLIRESIQAMKARGDGGIMISTSSAWSLRASLSLGFKVVNEIRYHDWVDKRTGEKPFKTLPLPHETTNVLVLQ